MEWLVLSFIHVRLSHHESEQEELDRVRAVRVVFERDGLIKITFTYVENSNINRYSDGEIGKNLSATQIRLPLQPLWRNTNESSSNNKSSSVKWMLLDDLLKLCERSKEKEQKRIPKNVNLIKVARLFKFHCDNGIQLRTSFDTEARFRIRILNAAGASEWSELSENVFLTDGVLKEQKPPRATSYCVRNADITVQWPLRYSTIERRKQDVTALPAHTHQVEMLVTNGKRISEALEFLRPGMRIEIEWDEYGM